MKLRSQNLLQIFLHLGQALSADRDGANFRQAHPPFAVHGSRQTLRDASP